MRLKRSISLALAAATLAVSAFTGQSARAQVDFSGQRIEMIVGANAGGTADIVARYVANVLSQELPGQPTILVRNLTAGGSIEAANYFQREGKPDGLMMFYSTPSSIMNPVFSAGESQIQYDPRTWVQFLGLASGYIYSGSDRKGIRGLDELKMAIEEDRQMTVGMSSPAGVALMYVMAMEVMGGELVPAFGTGSGDSATGFLRGEFDLSVTSIINYNNVIAPLIPEGEVFPLFTLGHIDDDGELMRDPAQHDIPHLGEAYETMFGSKPEGEAFDIYLTLVNAMIANSRAFMLPEGTPKEILDAYSEAAERGLANYQDDPVAVEILGVSPIVVGDKANLRMSRMMKGMTPRLVDYLRDLYATKFNVPL